MLQGRQDTRALERAVEHAWTATVAEHRVVLSRCDVNEGFLEHEGAREVARIMLAGREPDARVLARACVRSLGAQRHARGSDPLVAPFQAFLDGLAEELSRHARFRTRLAEVASTRVRRATLADELELLEWLAGHHEYLRTTGIGTTQHLQLPLADVFVQPRALREQRAGKKWGTRVEKERAVLDERLRTGEIAHDEYEALLDRLGVVKRDGSHVSREVVAVNDVLRGADRVVILGDPGTGKTTLLRYLALRHAQALLDDDEAGMRGELGAARLPLYVRAGEFARSQHREAGMRAFLTAFLRSEDCTLSSDRLDVVIDDALRSGRCLVLTMDWMRSRPRKSVRVSWRASGTSSQLSSRAATEWSVPAASRGMRRRRCRPTSSARGCRRWTMSRSSAS